MYWAPNAVHTPMEASDDDLKLFEGHPRQTLAAMTWALDRAVGRIVDKLEREGISDNTLIFFLSDNGGAHNNQSSNLPLKGFKGNKYEGGHRVSFFMHWPKELKDSRQYDGLTSALDIFATSIAVGGAREMPHKPLDGVNLMPYLQGSIEGEPHEQLFWRKGQMAAHRKGDYKMIRVDDLGCRMYNLKDDLQESHDLCVKDKPVFDDLNSELEEWETELMNPLWTEGQVWDTITWMIHQDYFNNVEPRVKNPEQLKDWKKY